MVQPGEGLKLACHNLVTCRGLALLVVLAGIAVLLSLALSSDPGQASPAPPASGDWTVGVGETVTQTGASLDLRGDLHVRGYLELDNCTLWVWLWSSGPRVLTVHPGGELRLVNSAVAGQGLGEDYVVRAEAGSGLTLDRSSIFGAGHNLTVDGRWAGVLVATDATVRGTDFVDCLVGLWVASADVTVRDATFLDCEYGAVVSDAGYLVVMDSSIYGCTRGLLCNASRMRVTYTGVDQCSEGILAFGGSVFLGRDQISNCTTLGVGTYNAEATLWDCIVRDSDADGMVFHQSLVTMDDCSFHDLKTDVKVVHSEAWITGSYHENTYDEAMWMYHATFHVSNVTTFESYWALKAWKSRGDCTNLVAVNTTFGLHLERCDGVLVEGLEVSQGNASRVQSARGVYVTGGFLELYNSSIHGVRTGIDMLSAQAVVRWVDIADCYEDGMMISLCWGFTVSDVNVTYAQDGFWLNLLSGGMLERCNASHCRESGYDFSAGATTEIRQCRSSDNPVGIDVRYASPVIRDCEIVMCNDTWCITNETMGMDALSGAPRVIGGNFTGGFGSIRLNDTRALVEGVTFRQVDRWFIQVRESYNDVIRGCDFAESPEATAIFVWRGTPVIEGNSFFRLNYAVTAAEDAHLVLRDNVVVNVTYDAVWVVANSSVQMMGNSIRDVGFYGVHVMLYSSAECEGDVVRDVGSYGFFVWKASSLRMTGGYLVNCSVGVYAFDATSIEVEYTELRDLNRGIISYKDKSANALTAEQEVRVEGCYFTNHSAYAIGVFDVDLTVVACTFLDNIAAMQVNNATVGIEDSTMVGSWLFGLKAEGSSRVTWRVEGRCRLVSSDIYGWVDIHVAGGDLHMEDLLFDPAAQSRLTSSEGSSVTIRNCDMQALGAVIRLTGSDVQLVNSTFTAVGPAVGGGPGTLGVTVLDGSLVVEGCTFRRARAGLSLVRTNATVSRTQFTECGEFGIYCRDSQLDLVGTRLNRTLVGSALHLDHSVLRATGSSVTIGVNGITMTGSEAEMVNCSMGGASGLSLQVSDGLLVLINTTYQTDRTGIDEGGTVEVWWYVTAKVLWPNIEELDLTEVSVRDATGSLVAAGSPDAAGNVAPMPVMARVLLEGGESPRGPHVVQADLLGYTVSVEVELASSRHVVLDLKDLDAPSFAVQQPLDKEVWIRSSALAVFGRAVDAGSGTSEVRVRVDYENGPLVSEGEAFSFLVPLSDGRHVVELVATDRAGNRATYSLVAWVETDPLAMTPPEPADGTVTRETSVTLRGRLSRVDGVTVRVNRVLATRDVANRSYHLTVELLEGENRFSVLAEDEYGHQTWANITIVADWTPPRLRITSPLDVNTTEEWVDITGTVDADARVYIQGSLVLLRQGAFSVRYPVYVGETGIEVRAEDAIGNAERVQVLVFRQEVSLEPPEPDPWEVYVFLFVIPVLMVAVYAVLRRLQQGGGDL